MTSNRPNMVLKKWAKFETGKSGLFVTITVITHQTQIHLQTNIFTQIGTWGKLERNKSPGMSSLDFFI